MLAHGSGTALRSISAGRGRERPLYCTGRSARARAPAERPPISVDEHTKQEVACSASLPRKAARSRSPSGRSRTRGCGSCSPCRSWRSCSPGTCGRRCSPSPRAATEMKEIAIAIQEGAKAYLSRQFSTLGVFLGILTVVLFFALPVVRRRDHVVPRACRRSCRSASVARSRSCSAPAPRCSPGTRACGSPCAPTCARPTPRRSRACARRSRSRSAPAASPACSRSGSACSARR